MTLVFSTLASLVLALGFLTNPPATQQDAAAEARPRVVTLVYDVSDIIFVPQQHSPPVAFGMAISRELPEPPPPAPVGEERVAQLLDVIHQNIEPDSWREHNGEVGTLQTLRNNLIITHTPAAHQQIQGMLSRLREFRAFTVQVTATFVTVGDDAVDEFDVTLQHLPDSDVRAAVLTNDQWETVLKHARAGDHARIIASPRILVHNGQSAFITITSGRPLLLPDADGADRMIEVAPLDGAALWIEPRVNGDRITLRADARIAEVIATDRGLIERAAEALATFDMTDGSRILLALVPETNRLTGARATDRDGEATHRITRERFQDAPAATTQTWVILQPTIEPHEENEEFLFDDHDDR